MSVTTELELGERLLEHGCDLYLAGNFPTYRDRLRAAILANGVELTVIGRRPDGKVENYQQCFERLYGEPLSPKKSRTAKGTGP